MLRGDLMEVYKIMMGIDMVNNKSLRGDIKQCSSLFFCTGRKAHKGVSESEISVDISNQPSQDDFGHPWSAANSYTGTRISTACSSTSSWGDNEFEKATSHQVQQMFCEIDDLLFEDKKCSRVQKLEKECQEWKCSFPHF
eukprot:g46659.t1